MTARTRPLVRRDGAQWMVAYHCCGAGWSYADTWREAVDLALGHLPVDWMVRHHPGTSIHVVGSDA